MLHVRMNAQELAAVDQFRASGVFPAARPPFVSCYELE
jgi:hypothetical protein